MKRALIIFTLLMTCGFLFAGGSRNSDGLTIKSGELSIGMDIGYPPMEEYANDGLTPIGFDVELSKAIAAKMGLRANFINTAWDGIFAGVETRRYDMIISSVTITPPRLIAHNFSRPYIANTLVMVVMKGNAVTAKTPDQTAGLNVAFQADTTADYYMEELAAAGLRYIPRRYDQVLHCFTEMEMGRVDVIITDLVVGMEYNARQNSPFEIIWRSTKPDYFGICMKQGNDTLTNAVNSALADLFNDGTIHRLSREFFNGADLVSEARQQW